MFLRHWWKVDGKDWVGHDGRGKSGSRSLLDGFSPTCPFFVLEDIFEEVGDALVRELAGDS